MTLDQINGQQQPGLLKQVGNALIGSEKNLGTTIGQSIAAPKVANQLAPIANQHSDILDSLSQRIIQQHAAGQDTTRLTNAYNQLLASPVPTAPQVLPALNKTPKQVLGEVGGVALDAAAPFVGGEGLKGASAAEKALSLGKTVAKGAGLGYGLDVTQNLQQDKGIGESLNPGAGTAIGAALPLVGPAFQGISRLASEASGVATGLNHGGNQALYDAISAGGEKAQLARDAMRGKILPEEVQQNAVNALNSIKSQKNADYVKALSGITDSSKQYDVQPIVDRMHQELQNFGVKVTPEGLDFGSSPLRFNTEAKNDISSVYNEMKNFGSHPEDTTAQGLDSLKRAFGDLYSPSGEARKFTTSMSSGVRDILKTIPGYDRMSQEYAQKTSLVNDIQKNLSLGTKSGIDTAYRKFSNVLRNDTDARKQLLQELDKASGGKLIPQIAGSLAKPILPRGLTRLATGLSGAVAGEGAGGGGLLGVAKAMVTMGAVTSPRLAGEVINALGVTGEKSAPIRNALAKYFSKYQMTKVLKGYQDNNQ